MPPHWWSGSRNTYTTKTAVFATMELYLYTAKNNCNTFTQTLLIENPISSHTSKPMQKEQHEIRENYGHLVKFS
jgi:hypothetical protein